MADAPPASSQPSGLSPLPSELQVLPHGSSPGILSDRSPEPSLRISSPEMKQSNSACELSPTRDTSPVDQSLTNRNLPTKEETALLETQLEESLANAHEHKSPTQIPTLSPEQTGEMAPLRRSGRQPRATQKASPTTTTTKVIIKKPKTTRRKNWSAEDLLTNAKSPLVNGDIRVR